MGNDLKFQFQVCFGKITKPLYPLILWKNLVYIRQ